MPEYSVQTYTIVNSSTFTWSWSISPSWAGTILNGNGTPTVTVQWAAGPTDWTITASELSPTTGASSPTGVTVQLNGHTWQITVTSPPEGGLVAASLTFPSTAWAFEYSPTVGVTMLKYTSPILLMTFKSVINVQGTDLGKLTVGYLQKADSLPAHRAIYTSSPMLAKNGLELSQDSTSLQELPARDGDGTGGPFFDQDSRFTFGSGVTTITLVTEDSPTGTWPLTNISGSMVDSVSKEIHFTMNVVAQTSDAATRMEADAANPTSFVSAYNVIVLKKSTWTIRIVGEIRLVDGQVHFNDLGSYVRPDSDWLPAPGEIPTPQKIRRVDAPLIRNLEKNGQWIFLNQP